MKKNVVMNEVKTAKAIILYGKVWNKGSQFRVYFENENNKCYFDAVKNTWNGEESFVEAVKAEVNTFAEKYVEVSDMDVLVWLSDGYEGLNSGARVPMVENGLVCFTSELFNTQKAVSTLVCNSARITAEMVENVEEFPLMSKYMKYFKYVPYGYGAPYNTKREGKVIECENEDEEVVDTISCAELKAEVEKFVAEFLADDEEVEEVEEVENTEVETVEVENLSVLVKEFGYENCNGFVELPKRFIKLKRPESRFISEEEKNVGVGSVIEIMNKCYVVQEVKEYKVDCEVTLNSFGGPVGVSPNQPKKPIRVAICEERSEL